MSHRTSGVWGGRTLGIWWMHKLSSFCFQVRERLRVALERCSLLEEELGATHKEVSLINHREV